MHDLLSNFIPKVSKLYYWEAVGRDFIKHIQKEGHKDILNMFYKFM